MLQLFRKPTDVKNYNIQRLTRFTFKSTRVTT